jgi:hypothetical protein
MLLEHHYAGGASICWWAPHARGTLYVGEALVAGQYHMLMANMLTGHHMPAEEAHAGHSERIRFGWHHVSGREVDLGKWHPWTHAFSRSCIKLDSSHKKSIDLQESFIESLNTEDEVIRSIDIDLS